MKGANVANEISTPSANETLPTLITRAASALSGATSSAEVLEARDFARVAYDAAKSAGRMAAAKRAHDDVIGAVYRAQADAALIEARAKMRLADEYDAAQGRGEVATRERNPGSVGHVGGDNMPPATAADLGLRRDEIHEARKLRDAEAAEPGKADRVMQEIIDRGEEPTKAALKKAMIEEKAEPEPERSPEESKLRRAIAGLTREALADDLVAERLARAEDKAKIAALKAEVETLKGDLAAFREASDMGRAMSNAQRAARAAEGRMKEYQAQAVRLDRQLKAVTKERDELRKWRENQVVDL